MAPTTQRESLPAQAQSSTCVRTQESNHKAGPDMAVIRPREKYLEISSAKMALGNSCYYARGGRGHTIDI